MDVFKSRELFGYKTVHFFLNYQKTNKLVTIILLAIFNTKGKSYNFTSSAEHKKRKNKTGTKEMIARP